MPNPPSKRTTPKKDKPGPRRVLLSDFKAKKEQEGAIEIETDDGEVYVIPPPELWSDDVIAAVRTDEVAAAKVMLGGRYEAFVAAGGSAAMIMAIFKDYAGVSPGES